MKNTLFIKTVTGFILISFALVLAIMVISNQIIETYHLNSVRDYVASAGTSISIPVSDYLSTQDYEGLNIFINTVGNKVDYRITVIEPDGRVVADSEEDPALMDDHGGRTEIADALRKEIGESIRYSTTLEKDMLYHAIPLLGGDGSLIGVLRVSIFLDKIETLLTSLRTKIYIICGIVLMISLCIIYIYTYGLTRPIRELTNAAKKFSEGDFNIKVISHKKDDIGYMINAFNDMTAYIRKLIEELTYRKSSLDTIISSMREGLCLIDESGSISEANNSFRKIIEDDDDILNKKYWEVVKNPELAAFISEVNKERKALSREIVMKNTYYLGSGLITGENELLILVHNINELKNIERIKKDIVANVSHELRSPLTAIKGFIETLEGELSEQGKEFLNIIQRNVNRLINIVNDLLTLSRLERGEHLEMTELNLVSVVKNICKVFEGKVLQKNIRLQIDLPEILPPIRADEFKIEQLLSNLIDNAIHYTDKGEIVISACKEDRFVCITVSDTGCGIPEDALEHIFERFYVVDKSRSRKYGGTGLGLSIVKHIALLHNGSVKVKSELGKGSSFRVCLPL